MHGAIGVLAIIALVGWVFGERTAKALVGSVLIMIVLAFLYVMYRIVTETI
jgi:hypothetical protein